MEEIVRVAKGKLEDKKPIVLQKSPEEKAADEFNELIARKLGKFKA